MTEPDADGSAAEDLLGLVGRRLPSVSLPTASGKVISFSGESGRWTVLFCYPGDGLGEKYPHLRGCTAEACGFRDAYRDLIAAGARVYGVSAQPSKHQAQFARNNGLKFELLSDGNLKLANALGLPSDTVEGKQILLRLTLVADPERIIRRVFFPIHDVAIHPRKVLSFFGTSTRLPPEVPGGADGFDRL